MSRKNPNQIRPAMIATIPKSGTMRCGAFFHVFSNLLKGEDATAIGTPPGGGNIEIPELGARFMIGHSMYPGIESLDQQQLNEWEQIPIPDASYNNIYPVFRKVFGRRRKNDKPPPRIVHLYRNPLDQAISIYQNKIALQENQENGALLDDFGRRWELELSGMFRGLFLPLWLKLHYSFLVAREKWPQRVLLLTFEELMAEPVTCFESILAFFRIELEDDWKKILRESVKRTEKEEIRKIEEEHQNSLWNIEQESFQSTTPLVDSWRHVRDGSNGQWKSEFTDADIEFAQAYLKKFGLDLERLLAVSV